MSRLLAVTGGHSVDMVAFAAMCDAVCEERGWTWVHEEQPAAHRWLQPRHAGEWSAVFLHDLPGLALRRGSEPTPSEPDPELREAVIGLLEAGQGVVATHHALAGWPTWDTWAEVLGGRFLYAPGTWRGRPHPASGYRMDTYDVRVAAPDHPVCAGVEPFTLADELYLCPVSESVVPLLCTDADLTPSSMIDTHREVATGERTCAADQASMRPWLGWANRFGASPLVYLLPGHGASTMQHPQYRRLLGNAVEWVASPAAHRWASEGRR